MGSLRVAGPTDPVPIILGPSVSPPSPATQFWILSSGFTQFRLLIVCALVYYYAYFLTLKDATTHIWKVGGWFSCEEYIWVVLIVPFHMGPFKTIRWRRRWIRFGDLFRWGHNEGFDTFARMTDSLSPVTITCWLSERVKSASGSHPPQLVTESFTVVSVECGDQLSRFPAKKGAAIFNRRHQLLSTLVLRPQIPLRLLLLLRLSSSSVPSVSSSSFPFPYQKTVA